MPLRIFSERSFKWANFPVCCWPVILTTLWFPPLRCAHQGLSVQGTSPENCAALTYFTENGGRFTISTGRSAATFAPYAAQLPLNAPAVVSGGGALYDYSTGRYCMMTHLPPCAAADLSVLAERFPGAALELYHADETVWVLHPNAWSEEHRRTTHSRMCPVTSLDQVVFPLHKALFEAPPEQLLGAVLRPAYHSVRSGL